MPTPTPEHYDPARQGPATRDKALAYRRIHCESETPTWYSGIAHFWFTSTVPLAAVFYCVWSLDNVSALEWLTIPLTFLYANLAEYLGHRGPMHHRWRFLPQIYLHTTIHHRYFTHDAFGFDEPRDFHALLLPPYFVLFFFAAFALPLGAVLFYFLSPNVSYLFIGTALAYFLSYEWMHLSYHMADDSWVLRLPFMRRLRRLHHEHHNPSLMTHYNFNITFPIFDHLFGTIYSPESSHAGTADSLDTPSL